MLHCCQDWLQKHFVTRIKNTVERHCLDNFPLAYCSGSDEPFPYDQLESLQLQSSCLLCQRLILLGFETGWEIWLEIIAVLMIQWECRLSQKLLDSNKKLSINCNLCYCDGFCCQCKEKPTLKEKHIQLPLVLMSSFLILMVDTLVFSIRLRCKTPNYMKCCGVFLFSVGSWAQVPKSLWTCRKGNLPVLLRNKGNFIWPVILQTTTWKLWKKVGDAFFSTSLFSEGI